MASVMMPVALPPAECRKSIMDIAAVCPDTPIVQDAVAAPTGGGNAPPLHGDCAATAETKRSGPMSDKRVVRATVGITLMSFTGSKRVSAGLKA